MAVFSIEERFAEMPASILVQQDILEAGVAGIENNNALLQENVLAEKEEREEKDHVILAMIEALNRKLAAKGRDAKQAKAAKEKPKKARKTDDISSVVEAARFADGHKKQYNFLDEHFSYLGKLKTATNIYREHFIEYSKSEQKKEDVVPDRAKTQDMTYNEFEEIVRIKKINDLFGATMEHINASMKERWDMLNIFPFYRILSILRYTFSMT